MTFSEIVPELKAGKKVCHRFFSSDEWMIMTPEGDFKFEDGVVCSPHFFWRDRQGKDWDYDWRIYNEK